MKTNLHELILSRIENDLNPITGDKLVPQNDDCIVYYNDEPAIIPRKYIHYTNKGK